MSRGELLDAIVLRSYDVGEADRFCVFLTRERGRIAARASGARKMKSRLGGSLQMLQHITLGLQEGSAGFIVTSASLLEEPKAMADLPFFLCMEQGMEILLSLVQHEHPLPDVFDATLCFIRQGRISPSRALLWYELRLLHLLGLLPEQEEMERRSALSAMECLFLSRAYAGELHETESDQLGTLRTLCTRMVEDQLSKPLRSTAFKAILDTAAAAA